MNARSQHEYDLDLPYGHPQNEDYAYDVRRQEEVDMDGVTFDEEKHEYRIDGARVPSVTEIIKPVQRELGGSPATIDYKRQIGKALDAAIIIMERGEQIDEESLDMALVPFLQAWLKFKRETGFRVLLNQQIVYSRKLRFAGTPDMMGTRMYAESSNPNELIDTKCVYTMDPVTAIQTAGYSIAAEESLGIKVKRRGGLQLRPDGTYRYYPYTSPMDEQIFKCCLSIAAWKGLNA